jgi:hypothetical protein
MGEVLPLTVILTQVRIHERGLGEFHPSCSWMLNQVQHDGVCRDA